jgi:hypothetical protein
VALNPLEQIQGQDGRHLDFDDRPVGTKHQVTDIDIAIPFVSNLPRHLGEFVQPRLSAVVNGSPLHIRGETLPFENSLRTHVALQLENVDLPRYVGYSPQKLPVSLDSGKLDGRIEVQFTQAQRGKEPAVVVKGGLALRDLAMSTPGRELAKLALIQVDGINVDLLKKDVRIESLAVKGGTLSAARRADGSLDLPVMTAAADSQAAAAKPWQVVLAKATIDDVQVSLADEAVKPAATHRASLVHVEAMNLSTDRTVKPDLAARLALEKGGTVEVQSTVALDPLVIDANVDARGIDLVPYRPYVEYFQTVKLKSGLATAKGHVELREGGSGGLKVAYAGTAEVSRFATFDTASKEDLLNWDSVRTGRVAQQAADGPWTRRIRHRRGEGVFARGRRTQRPHNLRQPSSRPTRIRRGARPGNLKPRNVLIDRVKFVDSRLNFTDHYIKPNYTADVGALNGTVTGLSSDPSSRAKVDLKGSYDKSGDVVIAGTVNPLSGDLFLDIAAKGSDIELPPLSAYSLRYAGYPITQGRLTLDVKYHVEGGTLDGRNKIVLDHLTFGDKVEGPDATTLPVLFAVKPLKDENGRIDLELPIGARSRIRSSTWALIWVVSNLLKKAVTAPFSLLRSIRRRWRRQLERAEAGPQVRRVRAGLGRRGRGGTREARAHQQGAPLAPRAEDRDVAARRSRNGPRGAAQGGAAREARAEGRPDRRQPIRRAGARRLRKGSRQAEGEGRGAHARADGSQAHAGVRWATMRLAALPQRAEWVKGLPHAEGGSRPRVMVARRRRRGGHEEVAWISRSNRRPDGPRSS